MTQETSLSYEPVSSHLRVGHCYGTVSLPRLPPAEQHPMRWQQWKSRASNRARLAEQPVSLALSSGEWASSSHETDRRTSHPRQPRRAWLGNVMRDGMAWGAQPRWGIWKICWRGLERRGREGGTDGRMDRSMRREISNIEVLLVSLSLLASRGGRGSWQPCHPEERAGREGVMTVQCVMCDKGKTTYGVYVIKRENYLWCICDKGGGKNSARSTHCLRWNLSIMTGSMD